MEYVIKPRFEKDLKNLEPELLQRLALKLDEISNAENISELTYKKLKGFELYRFRVGDYRLVFSIESDSSLEFLRFLKRNDVYKKL